MRSRAIPYSSLPAWSFGLVVVHLLTWENAWNTHLWTLVRGQVARTAFAKPLPPSVTTTSGAGIGSMSADHALELSDSAMYHETTRSPLQQISTTRRSASQIPSTKRTRWTSPSGTGMGQTSQNSEVRRLKVRPAPGISSWVPFDSSHDRNSSRRADESS